MKVSARGIRKFAFRVLFVALALAGGIALVSNIEIPGPEQAGIPENDSNDV